MHLFSLFGNNAAIFSRNSSHASKAPRLHEKHLIHMADSLKSYPAHWQGSRLILACRKCQKKLKHQDDLKPLANLKKIIKHHNKGHQNPLHLINVGCMDLCPKNAVALCLPGHADDRLLLLRSAAGLDALDTLQPAPSPTREALPPG